LTANGIPRPRANLTSPRGLREKRLGIGVKPAYKAAMTAQPTSAQLIEQGLFHHRQGDLAMAMDRYTQVLRTDPQNPDALYYIALVCCNEGQFQQGIDLARRSITNGGARARANNLIGQALHRMGKIKDALDSFDTALEADPNFADAYGNRANMLSELGRQAEALSSFDRALAINPNSAIDWVNRGATLHSLGRIDDAIASYDRAIAIDSEFAIVHLNRAGVMAEIGRWPEALEGFERAISLVPDATPAHVGRAAALQNLGRLDDALAACDRAITLTADYVDAHKRRADILQAMGRDEDAKTAQAKAEALEAARPPAAT